MQDFFVLLEVLGDGILKIFKRVVFFCWTISSLEVLLDFFFLFEGEAISVLHVLFLYVV